MSLIESLYNLDDLYIFSHKPANGLIITMFILQFSYIHLFVIFKNFHILYKNVLKEILIYISNEVE